MSYAIREVLEFVKQNDVKFIRLAFWNTKKYFNNAR